MSVISALESSTLAFSAASRNLCIAHFVTGQIDAAFTFELFRDVLDQQAIHIGSTQLRVAAGGHHF